MHDWKQCRAKVKVKDNNGKTGRGRQSCKFYDKLDQILGHKPASMPSTLLDTGQSFSIHPETEESEQDEADGKDKRVIIYYIPMYLC